MTAQQHSLDPLRAALRDFEEAVRQSQKKFFKSEVMERQTVDRARERVMETVMELVRQTLKEKGVD